MSFSSAIDEGEGQIPHGWLGDASDDPRDVAVQEPEAEDEADGWEIVSRHGAAPMTGGRGGRPRSSSGDYSPFGDRFAADEPEIPEDLIMGCLDPECDLQFSECCERFRCGRCHLLFCEKHIVVWPLLRGAGADSRGTCSGGPGSSAEMFGGGGGGGTCDITRGGGTWTGNSASSRSKSPRPQPVTLAEAALGMPVSTSLPTVSLCNECIRSLSPPPAPTRRPTLGPKNLEMADPQSQPGGAAQPSGTDVAALAAELQALQDMPIAKIKGYSTDEDEPASRVVARGLLMRLLARLRRCLRPWADAEREWVWRLREELIALEPGWLAQFVSQASWESFEEARGISGLIQKAYARRLICGREALQILAVLGRRASSVVETLGERQLGLIATHAAEAIGTLGKGELACCLELLLDAAQSLGSAGATGGRRAIVGALLCAAGGDAGPSAASLRGELFWALEARSATAAMTWGGGADHCGVGDGASGGGSAAATAPAETRMGWASLALEELLRSLSNDQELGLLRQRTWVQHLERGEVACARNEPGPWGEARAFPLAVWPPGRLCLGLDGQPRGAASKSAPVILRCRCMEETNSHQDVTVEKLEKLVVPSAASAELPAPPVNVGDGGGAVASSAGLLLKRDSGMRREQQVGQTLRLLERLIWEEESLCDLLTRAGLQPEDVRATYTIAMTGPATAIVEFVEGACTLREVRAAAHQRTSVSAPVGGVGNMGTLLEFLRQNNNSRDLPRALARLACTSAISAVLSFVAGLGDRHHENFMVTTDGRLLHVDYGYALGREPLDAVLIHYAVQGGRPIATLQYEELYEALGQNLVRRVFWPVARAAYLRVRMHAGLLVEMVNAAVMRDVRWGRHQLVKSAAADQREWGTAQAFVARRCATALSDSAAERFIHALLWHCARHERGAKFRDELRGLCIREKTHYAVSRAYGAALATGRSASAAVGMAATVVGNIAAASGGTHHRAGGGCGGTVVATSDGVGNDGHEWNRLRAGSPYGVGAGGGTRSSVATTPARRSAPAEPRGLAAGLMLGVRELLKETSAASDHGTRSGGYGGSVTRRR
eukprot:TRINITY_DN61902_c0_g1_i1.p1 TRINITY_DN61902_c0_g1~~TRINITY_DN61902_c0_g1_i1.p1  ORF type:complete len:1085 (-),score=167.57 TRINITY_DN61902_c0_g1_i1:43-3246(-)